MDFDDILVSYIGGFGKYQKCMFALMLCSAISVSFHTFVHTFTGRQSTDICEECKTSVSLSSDEIIQGDENDHGTLLDHSSNFDGNYLAYNNSQWIRFNTTGDIEDPTFLVRHFISTININGTNKSFLDNLHHTIVEEVSS